jgi:hypothetical protein
MFAGHVGVGLAIGRVERRVNVGVFVASALLLDFVLWLFVLGGLESASVPPDFTATHQSNFVFPYSHGLVAACVWSALAGALAFRLCARLERGRWRAGLLVAAAVCSHWWLDVLVHRPEMPLAGQTSAMVGVALWNHMPAALAVEVVIAALGLYLFLRGSGLARGKLTGLAILGVLVIAFTVVGMTVASAPSSVFAMAVSSLTTLALVSTLFVWLGRWPRARQA